jgi:hypothetical protein
MTSSKETERKEFSPLDDPFQYLWNLPRYHTRQHTLRDGSVIEITIGRDQIHGREFADVVRVAYSEAGKQEEPHEEYLLTKGEVLHADWEDAKPRLVRNYPMDLDIATEEQQARLHQKRLFAIAFAVRDAITEPPTTV